MLFITDPFAGLVYSQMMLSIQLPLSVGLLVWLTSRKRIMGDHVNTAILNIILVSVLAVITALNVRLFISFFTGR